MREKLRSLMAGRYGMDKLGMALLITVIALNLVFSFTGFLPLRLIGLCLLGWELVRLFSRNIERHRQENRRFEEKYDRLRYSLSGFVQRLKQSRDYKFFRCGDCGNFLRVPRGKGKINVTCPRCGKRFSARS